MKKFASSLTIVFIIIIAQISNSTTILIYHKIGDSRTPSTNLSIENFQKQMKYLYDNHYRIMPLKKVVNMIKHKKILPKKSVVITFDDGYRTVYTNAFPILKKYKFQATVFLPTKAIQKHYPDYMTIKQIKEMQAHNIDFQSHSYSHPRMAYKPKDLTQKQYIDLIKNELASSINFFKKYLGYKPYAFAIPYGEYNKFVIEEAKKQGFEAILTQDTGAVSKDTPLYLMPREPILGKYWSTMKHFKYVINHEEYLPIEKRYPDIGTHKNITKAGATIKNFKKYKNFMIYTSVTGWKQAKIKGNFVYIDNITIKEKRKKLHIGIKAVDKKNLKDAKVFWMVAIGK